MTFDIRNNWLYGTVALMVAAAIGVGAYLTMKPAEYTNTKLGKAVLLRAMHAIEEVSNGNTPHELQCSRKGEPVGNEPVFVVCKGNGSKGPFTAAFWGATRLPQFSLDGQISGADLIVTKFDGVPQVVGASLAHTFEEVFAAPPQITN